MAYSSNLGIGRMGANRELKKAVEGYWKKEISEAELHDTAKQIQLNNWKMQKDAGIDLIPSGDFSMYDQVLDTICMVGAVPQRYNKNQSFSELYFAMARGQQDKAKGINVPAMEMTKWFDTNYHYIVPEFERGQKFSAHAEKPVITYNLAKENGFETKPVIIGPITFLLLGKMKDGGSTLDLLPNLLPVYEEIISQLAKAGAKWIQIDEPALVLDLPEVARDAYKKTYEKLAKAANVKILLATYFEDLKDNLDLALSLPVTALHLDLVRAPGQLESALAKAPKDLILSLGVIDGRNIWKNDFAKSLSLLEKAASKLGKDRVIVAPSCSLLHTPVDLDLETKLDSELKNWLAFAKQKLSEVSVLAKALNQGEAAVKKELAANAEAIKSRKNSARIHNPGVKKRTESITEDMAARKSPFARRKQIQNQALGLPLLPTTTIGSFPQTTEVRAARAEFKRGKLSQTEYNNFLKKETEKTVRYQEKAGIDVLVHGEFERNDMVEYFGEQLEGFAFTSNGWVQSYGSRCVKPPVIFGDVSRKGPMTVEWSKFAQSLTKKIMKGMLTGPVTILQWSFVRDDQPREITCKQIALAIRDEVSDLEKAGIKIIQIDEPAIREGLPLHKKDWQAYLKWAVDSFRISAASVKDETQIHTHMCYSEFNDIIGNIADMDADVISIETSRSQMELLDAFVSFKYPNEIGPGVYDIHTQRIPAKDEIENLLRKALKVLSADQIWVNPDCGLKTRGWKEVEPALEAMVEAAKELRGELAGGKKATA